MFDSHKKIEKNVFILTVLTVFITSIGAIIEIFPLFEKEVAIERVEGMRPYTPLELAGFEIYKREGCYGCHSQQIRTLRDEVERYGHYSLAAESMYDYPFMWGSKRTGPDLARLGDKYSDDWHREHFINPRSLVPASIMPSYIYLIDKPLDYKDIPFYMDIYKKLGVPYTEKDLKSYENDLLIQGGYNLDPVLIENFRKRYPNAIIHKPSSKKVTEHEALIAYLQTLGNMIDLKSNQGRDW